jgi:hypothetical protein
MERSTFNLPVFAMISVRDPGQLLQACSHDDIFRFRHESGNDPAGFPAQRNPVHHGGVAEGIDDVGADDDHIVRVEIFKGLLQDIIDSQ